MKKNIIMLGIVLTATFLPACSLITKTSAVLTPTSKGLTCLPAQNHIPSICLEDISRETEARTLYSNALDYVNKNVGIIQKPPPRILFCSTIACSQRLGFRQEGAYNVGTVGLVISHRAWQPFYMRHELIHHLQNERLGTLNCFLFKPTWFTEGMAYSLSDDPRQPLPKPLQDWRLKFDQWLATVGLQQMWTASKELY